MVALTVDKLLQQFVNLKQTGKDIPGIVSWLFSFGQIIFFRFRVKIKPKNLFEFMLIYSCRLFLFLTTTENSTDLRL